LASASAQSDLAGSSLQIDAGAGYWLSRIEQELVGRGLRATQQLCGIQRVIREYKEATGKLPFHCAEA